ncbi:hypothetical protein [Paenibacillus typhae]|uniref:Sporulation lipoprotein YhcN/YlaJ (Spore_YhcN_YlaJ) n=1 Tax=Paenibacillus typhae TaxID=1174501 RepID=A0A1G9DYC0_9BACL|nr:hypothetical protein [Paenibacillus typhae]SDK68829.1 hypothetical protein SAMN05216192_15029 [Paenibacillus typhae]
MKKAFITFSGIVLTLFLLTACQSNPQPAEEVRMSLSDVNKLLDEHKMIFKEASAANPAAIISQTATAQVTFIFPLTYQTLHVYEFENAQELADEREALLERFEEAYFDAEVVEIVHNNVYMVTAKDLGEEESELERQVREIFEGEK